MYSFKSISKVVRRTDAVVSPLLTVGETAAYLRWPRRWVYYVTAVRDTHREGG